MTILCPLLLICLTSVVPHSIEWNNNTTSENHSKTIEGELRLFGNEPFTRVALVTDNEKRYFLIMDDDKISRLWSNCRSRIRISGIIVEKYYLGKPAKFIEVKKYEWVTDLGNNK